MGHVASGVQYSFLETWQKAQDFCQSQNATLLTIKDDEEANFIKVKLFSTVFSINRVQVRLTKTLSFLLIIKTFLISVY